MNQFDIFETKEAALEALEIARKEYLVRARRAAKTYAIYLGPPRLVTVDDVRKECPPPPNVDPRVMGAIFNTPDWETVGYIRSARKACHTRPIAQFRYVGS